MRILKLGLIGDDVTEMQTNLNKALAEFKHCNVTIIADGHFGSKTESSLKTFQGVAGLAVDGICGPKTKQTLELVSLEVNINVDLASGPDETVISVPWIDEATKHLGMDEIKGDEHNPEIVKLWKDVKLSGIKNDEVPWCAAFVGAMLERCGIRSTRSGASKSYLDWGEVLQSPVYGCVVVFSRKGGGHVGFVCGTDSRGNILVLGGNQSDEVNVRAFKPERVVGYRWPEGAAHTDYLPVTSPAAFSERED